MENENHEGNGNGTSITRYKTLEIDSVKYRTVLNHKFERRKSYEPKDLKKVVAVIPGTIVRVMVKQGSRVKEGERLLILEAMKMKNDVVSPIDGVVKAIHVAEGERVPKQHLLVEFR